MGWIIAGQDLAAIKADIKRSRPVYATMAITQRDSGEASPNDIAVTAHPSGNSILNPPSSPVTAGPGPFGGYHKVTAYLAEGIAKELSVVSAEMIIPNDGIFVVPVAYASFRHTANNATVALVFGIERAGQISFSQRPVSSKQPNLGDVANISGGGQLPSLNGDKMSVWVASDTTGTITIGNSNVTVHMLEDTT